MFPTPLSRHSQHGYSRFPAKLLGQSTWLVIEKCTSASLRRRHLLDELEGALGVTIRILSGTMFSDSTDLNFSLDSTLQTDRRAPYPTFQILQSNLRILTSSENLKYVPSKRPRW